MDGEALVPVAAVPVLVGTDRDERFLELWLQGRSKGTGRMYRKAVGDLFAVSGRGIGEVTLSDLQSYAVSLEALAPATQLARLAAVKSLLSFAYETGYVRHNVGRALRLPKAPSRLAERIIPEASIHRMFALEKSTRNRILLRVLYATGLRVSEVCGLRWGHLCPREKGGQASVVGKGRKQRVVLIPQSVWEEVVDLAGRYPPERAVFVSRQGGGRALTEHQVWKIVRAAAERAGVRGKVSPHWLRHAHASHAIDRGCPLSVVQAGLGHESVATTGKYLHARPSDGPGLYLAV